MRSIYRNTMVTLSFVALTSISNLASAKCATDLKGTWQLYGLLPLSNGAYYSCTFSTDKDGVLEVPGSVCNAYNADGSEAYPPQPDSSYQFLATGQYVADNACNVTGFLEIGAAATLTILDAKINSDATAIHGMQIIDFPSVETVEFTMFRML